MRLLITGGAGFIGSNLIRRLLAGDEHDILNIDKLVLPGSRHTIAEFDARPRYRHLCLDLCDYPGLLRACLEFRPDAVLHLAAESHVDRSLDAPGDFIHSNILGTFNLLESCRHYVHDHRSLRERFRFLHVSTDEVFGSLDRHQPAFTEAHPYLPNSPYAASKAASDHLVRAWHRSYGLATMISHCSNNYGPWQFPDKLIPLLIDKALSGAPLPIYGQGENIRDWLFVGDHVEALLAILDQGQPGETYNIGGGHECSNIDLARRLCQVLDDLRPGPHPYARQIEMVADRPGHDFRYAIDCGRIRDRLGWQPRTDFDSGLKTTAAWYLEHRDWMDKVRADAYHGERLGLAQR